MTRRLASSVFFLLAACSSAGRFRPDQLPQQVVGGWTREAVEALAPDLYAAEARRLNPRSAWRATYSGPARYRVTVYEMPAEAVAFELVQTSRSEPGTLGIQHKNLFLVASPAEEGGPVRREFLQALERTLP